MNVDITVAVWGDWHIRTLGASTLPSALAMGNLPRLAGEHQCRLSVFTRALDVERLGQTEALQAVKQLMPVQITAMTSEVDVSAPHHLAWWHRAGQDALARRAVVLNLPPDVVLPDGCLTNLVAPLGHGKVAVLAPPQLRVVEETLVRELSQRRRGPRDPLQISARDTVALGIRHLHPLFAQVVEGNPFGRPGIEHLWPVGDEGFMLCQTTREIIAYNPARCDITDRFLVSNAKDMSSIHTSTSSEDTFFLSLAPLMKDFGLVLSGHPATARFLARWSTHPDNDVPLASHLPDHLVRLEAKPATAELWQKVEGRARAWVRDYQRWRDVFHVWHAARKANCVVAGRLIGLAAHVVDVPKLFHSEAPTLAFLPSDAAFEAMPSERLRAMIAPGGEEQLIAFLRSHLAQPESEDHLAAQDGKIRTLNGVERRWQRTETAHTLDGRALGPPLVCGRITAYPLNGVFLDQ